MTSVGVYVALSSLVSCSNCDLAYGIEVRAINAFGDQSKFVKPSRAFSRGTGTVLTNHSLEDLTGKGYLNFREKLQ